MQVRIKTAFGEIVIEGETANDILETLQAIPQNFTAEVSSTISSKLAASVKSHLEGVVEVTDEGPVITTHKSLTHYETIGLILYALENKTGTAAQIQKLLQSSGIKSMVPARLNEMTRRGIVFKPAPSRPEFKLTTQGVRWVEDTILPKLKEGEK
ncbi:MAG: hypothetical protein ACUVT5_03400 [Candidatus Bathyarchaeales archaeon]